MGRLLVGFSFSSFFLFLGVSAMRLRDDESPSREVSREGRVHRIGDVKGVVS